MTSASLLKAWVWQAFLRFQHRTNHAPHPWPPANIVTKPVRVLALAFYLCVLYYHSLQYVFKLSLSTEKTSKEEDCRSTGIECLCPRRKNSTHIQRQALPPCLQRCTAHGHWNSKFQLCKLGATAGPTTQQHTGSLHNKNLIVESGDFLQ